MKIKNLRNFSDEDVSKYQLEKMKEAYEKLNKFKDINREKYKQYYDHTHKNVTFQTGDSNFVPSTTDLRRKLLIPSKIHWSL